MSELLILLPFVLVPAIALAFVRPAGRRILGAIGLAAGLLLQLVTGSGPDDFTAVFPFLALCLAAAALLGEGLALLIHLVRRRGPRAAGEGG